MASWWYLLGGLLVAAQAVMFILDDTQALPSLLVPAVMLLMGWLLWKL